MIINITFAEIKDYVKIHYNKNLVFSKVSEKEVCVAYEQHILFKTIQVPVSISIANVAADSVTITYNGGFGIDMIIAGTMAFLKAKIPELTEALIAEEAHRIRIELGRLDKTKALVEAVALNNIQIFENGIQVSASLK